MTDEKIYNMMVSPIIEDAIIAANFLIKKPLPDIQMFFRMFGYLESSIEPYKGFCSRHIINLKHTYSRLIVIKNKECMVWIGSNKIYLLANDYNWKYDVYKNSWEDVTI